MKKWESLFKKVELFEKLAVYGDRKSFLQALAQAAPAASLTGPVINPGTPGTPGGRPLSFSEKLKGQVEKQKEPVTIAPVTIEGTPPSGYMSIPKETQDQLNMLLVPPGNIVPLKTDGKLGPQTQKAIEIFKAKFQAPGTPAGIKEVYLRENNPGIVTKAPF